jgi:coenzyme F420-reducing hydrogenase delta subunit
MGGLIMTDFEPKILGFLCNWCAYAGADLAGVSRNQYPANLRVIRVMCSGRVDPVFILKAFQQGIDGVAVLGCHHGDCHYQTGNYEAEQKMLLTKKVLHQIGIHPDRLYLDWVSAAEGKRFSEVITGFTDTIKNRGPLTKDNRYKEKAELGINIVESTTIRWLIGKKRELSEQGNVYNEKLDPKQVEELLERKILEQYHKQRLLLRLESKPTSINTLAQHVQLSTQDVVGYLTSMEAEGQVKLYDFQDAIPRYQRVSSEEAVS